MSYGIFVIKHTLRDPPAATFDFTLFFFFLFIFSFFPFFSTFLSSFSVRQFVLSFLFFFFAFLISVHSFFLLCSFLFAFLISVPSFFFFLFPCFSLLFSPSMLFSSLFPYFSRRPMEIFKIHRKPQLKKKNKKKPIEVKMKSRTKLKNLDFSIIIIIIIIIINNNKKKQTQIYKPRFPKQTHRTNKPICKLKSKLKSSSVTATLQQQHHKHIAPPNPPINSHPGKPSTTVNEQVVLNPVHQSMHEREQIFKKIKNFKK